MPFARPCAPSRPTSSSHTAAYTDVDGAEADEATAARSTSRARATSSRPCAAAHPRRLRLDRLRLRRRAGPRRTSRPTRRRRSTRTAAASSPARRSSSAGCTASSSHRLAVRRGRAQLRQDDAAAGRAKADDGRAAAGRGRPGRLARPTPGTSRPPSTRRCDSASAPGVYHMAGAATAPGTSSRARWSPLAGLDGRGRADHERRAGPAGAAAGLLGARERAPDPAPATLGRRRRRGGRPAHRARVGSATRAGSPRGRHVARVGPAQQASPLDEEGAACASWSPAAPGSSARNFVRHLLARTATTSRSSTSTSSPTPATSRTCATSRTTRATASSTATSATPAPCAAALAGADAVVNFAAETHVDRSIGEPAGLHPHRRPRHATCCSRRRASRGVGALPPGLHRRGLRLDRGGLVHRGLDRSTPRAPTRRARPGADLLVLVLPPHLRPARPHHAQLEQLRPLPVPREAHPAVHHQRPRRTSRCRSTATGCNVRDWLYVEDHCAAIDLVLRARRAGRGLQRRRRQRGRRTSR